MDASAGVGKTPMSCKSLAVSQHSTLRCTRPSDPNSLIATPRTSVRRLVGGMPMRSPLWVPELRHSCTIVSPSMWVRSISRCGERVEVGLCVGADLVTSADLRVVVYVEAVGRDHLYRARRVLPVPGVKVLVDARLDLFPLHRDLLVGFRRRDSTLAPDAVRERCPGMKPSVFRKK